MGGEVCNGNGLEVADLQLLAMKLQALPHLSRLSNERGRIEGLLAEAMSRHFDASSHQL